MEVLRGEDIILDGIDTEYQIVDLEYTIKANEHGMASVRIAVNSENDIKNQLLRKIDNKVSVLGKDKVLFVGFINSVERVKRDSDFVIYQIDLISLSAELDRTQYKKSFQDVSKTMKDIIEMVLKNKNADLIFEAKDKSITMPLIQYGETEWEFIKRIASRMNTVVYPNFNEKQIGITIGFKQKNNKENKNVVVEKLKYCFDSQYWKKQEETDIRSKEDCLYYELNSYNSLSIGEHLFIPHDIGYVLEKKAILYKERLLFQYKVGYPALVYLSEYHNENFAGRVVQGELLKVENECVKLKFDFDEEQDIATAYGYQWIPETGNVMYLMPKEGSTINLFFKDSKEESAIAISCIRKNGGTCESEGNVNNRYLTTDYGKQMVLKEKMMGLINEKTNEGISLVDGENILFNSNMHITIISKKALHVNADSFVLSTPSELIMKKVTL